MNRYYSVFVLAAAACASIGYGQCLQWFPLAPVANPGDQPAGPDGVVRAMLRLSSGELIIGGDFTHAGGVSASHVARWDGSQWSPLGSGVDDEVAALAVLPSGDLVAAGTSLNADGAPASRVARWNGSAWSAMGAGFDNGVKSLAVLPNGELYAAGLFSSSGPIATGKIARWDGSSWQPVGNGTDEFELDSLAVSPAGDLLVGGYLHSANLGSVPALKIARWNGSQWFPFGGGLNSGVYSISAAANGDIIAGGRFTSLGESGSSTANRVARWNGSTWQPLGLGVGASVYAVLVLPNADVIAGGDFQEIDISSGGASLIRTTGAARWDGSLWTPISTGLNGDVYALTLLNAQGDFLAAGNFTVAGGRAATRIAICRATGGSPPVVTTVGNPCVTNLFTPFSLTVIAQPSVPANGPLIYQWRKDGLPLHNGITSSITLHEFVGVDSANLVIRHADASDRGRYDVVVYDAGGCATSQSVAPAFFCPADFDCSGTITISDLFDYLNEWLRAGPAAEFDGHSGLTVGDIWAYIGAWFTPCQ